MKTPKFVSHYNRTLGKYYGSSKDYYSDLKKGGYVPYDNTLPEDPVRKKYTPSPWARDVIKNIKNHTRKGKFTPSQGLINEITGRQRKTDMCSLPAHYQTGGMY